MDNLTVLELNDEVIVSMTLNMIVLAVYLFVGICGNVLVLLVHAFQMKNFSDERYFILILAACDLIATLYLGSFAIYNSINQVTYSHYVLCKTPSFFAGLATIIPICVLLIIAFQRYFKICMNLNQSRTLLFKRLALVLVILILDLVAMPLPFITEIIPVNSPRYRIIGTRCGSLRKGNKLARHVYFVLVGLFVIVTITTFIVLYSRIAYRIFRHFKKGRHQIYEKEKDANVEDSNT